MKEKLTSRKFWVCVAAFLGSIGMSIASITTNNQVVAAVGLVCAMLSAAIYSACEAYVDANTLTEEEYEELMKADNVEE